MAAKNPPTVFRVAVWWEWWIVVDQVKQTATKQCSVLSDDLPHCCDWPWMSLRWPAVKLWSQVRYDDATISLRVSNECRLVRYSCDKMAVNIVSLSGECISWVIELRYLGISLTCSRMLNWFSEPFFLSLCYYLAKWEELRPKKRFWS